MRIACCVINRLLKIWKQVEDLLVSKVRSKTLSKISGKQSYMKNVSLIYFQLTSKKLTKRLIVAELFLPNPF
jgi:hypothetical protein